MNLQPDFPDHWKTQRLIKRCGYEGVLCLLRLWLQCQQSKSWTFTNRNHIEAISQWKGDDGVFFDALRECMFLEESEGVFAVHDFEIHNANLIKNWKNASKKKSPPM